jgi:hypothetical protein
VANVAAGAGAESQPNGVGWLTWLRGHSRIGTPFIWTAWFLGMAIAGLVYAQKAADERSAFIRWRHQILEFGQGKNIWDPYYFPTPPIFAISIYPFMRLPSLAGALTWFALKVALATAAILLSFRMTQTRGRPVPWLAQGLVILLSLRPILSDLHHGNNNLIIMFLVIAALAAWRRGWDVLAGLVLGLAITFKLTPALFIPYLLYKRSWKTAVATLVGIGLFLLVVPSLAIGWSFNWQCLSMWFHRMLSPFINHDIVSPQEMNQSLGGVFMRFFTQTQNSDPQAHRNIGTLFHFHVLVLPPLVAARIVKALSLALVALLAVFCRTRTTRRDDPRLFGEFALVVLTMLFVSERSWKHHFVTLVLPFSYLAYRLSAPELSRIARWVIGGALVLASLLMLTTSTEVGGLFAQERGHQIAQFYGMFFWAGLILYAATAWRVMAERNWQPDRSTAIPPPHVAAPARAVTQVQS